MDSKPDTISALDEFSRAHALAQLLALVCVVRLRSAWPCAAVAVAQFATCFWRHRGRYTPRGDFGRANAITGVRALLTLSFALPKQALAPQLAALLAAWILLLDGLDGAVALRRGEASAFGAHFDMETDALFVLMVTLRLWLVESYGAWVLTAGLLRYAYVLSVWLAPGSGREAPRSQLGRIAFLGLALSLIAGLAWPGVIGIACMLAGTAVVSASFARSFYFSHFSS